MRPTDIAYNKGVGAWRRNPSEMNPYQPDTSEYEAWREGQKDAKFDDDLFESRSGHWREPAAVKTYRTDS